MNPEAGRDSVVFDLDGTLWDTCPTCATGWNNVLRRRGIAFREITVEDIRAVTGRPHEDCIRPGVEAGLHRLGRRLPLFIVSNCQAGYIETFLTWSGLGKLFGDVECWGNTGLSKGQTWPASSIATGCALRSWWATPRAIRAPPANAASRSSTSTADSATAPRPTAASRPSMP